MHKRKFVEGMSMKTKTLSLQKYPHAEKALAEIKTKHPDFVPNETDLSILRGLDDLVHGRVKVLRRPSH